MSTLNLEDFYLLTEGQELECKSAQGRDGKGELPQDFWKTYSAMANTEGGTVWLGIQEKPKGLFRPIGIQHPEKIIQDLTNNLNNRKQISHNLLTQKNIQTVDIDGKIIIKIDIPRSSRQQRPVYIGENPIGGTYLRRNEGDYQADSETVKRILAEQIEDSRDEKLLKGFGLADLDRSTIEAYRNRFSAVKPNHAWIDLPLMDFLERIGAFGVNRETGEHGLRLAGLLMFGRGEVIVDAVPHYMLDYQERPEAKAERRWIDRITPDGTWSGNVYDFFRRVYPKLTQDLPVPFQVEQGQRIDDSPAHIAIREALVNALVHADYTGRMSILVVKRPDLFGFRNAGLMRVPLKLALQGGHSDCRNRRMQTMFQLVGYGDKAGSGIPSILHGWSEQHWRRPLFQQVEDPEQTLISLKMASLLPNDAVKALQKHIGQHFDSLNTSERLTLVTAYVEGSIQHGRIKDMCTEHSTDITKMLTHLVQSGLLKAQGFGRGKTYYLPWRENHNAYQEFVQSNDITENIPLTQQGSLKAQQGSLKAQQGSLEAQQGSLKAQQGSLEALSTQIIILEQEQISNEEYNQLLEIAFPIRTKERAQPEMINDVILKLCKSHYLSPKLLADLLQRDHKRLLKKFLTPLVEQGRLIRAYTNPSNPKQAYKTNNQEE